MSSCSNELDHTSDAAEDHPHGQDSQLPNYYSLSTLYFFSVLLHQTSNPSSVPPWLPPETSSTHPTLFHFSRSILNYAAFTSRAPSMPTAMPNLAHTTQLRKQVGHAFPCNNDGAPSQQDS